MTREEAKRAAEVMLAYADGKEIECLCDGGWSSAFFPKFDWYNEEYRIKPKQPKFDPKTLKSFDKVLQFSTLDAIWTCDFYSHKINEDILYPYECVVAVSDRVIPYNDDTKHLVGTAEEAPEYYRYWED